MTFPDALFFRHPWLILPEALRSMHAASRAFFEAERELPTPPESEFLRVEDGVGVIEIHGPLMRKPDLLSQIFFGAVDTEELIAAVREAGAHEDVKAIFLDVDSPGGTVEGTPELADAVADIGRTKAVYAFTAGQMHSAAYWIASQADAIYATPSARVGSIGVILPIIDDSEAFKMEGLKVEVFAAGKFKSTGTPGTSLTDDQRAWLQSQVDEIAADFRDAVLARGRRIPDSAMEGQTFSTRQAQRLNLAGMVKDRDEAMRRLRTYHVASNAAARTISVDTRALAMSKPIEDQLAEAVGRIQKLEADAQASASLLADAAKEADELKAQIALLEAEQETLKVEREKLTCERSKASSDLAAALHEAESLASKVSQLETRLTQLTARNAELEAAEKDIETRASRRAAEIVAATGSTAPAPVTARGDHQTDDLVARFKAISNPAEQTTFWRGLSAQQQALILSGTAHQ